MSSEHGAEAEHEGDRVRQRCARSSGWSALRAAAAGRRAPAEAAALTMPIWPRYAGTTGRTHGDRNEIRPAKMAAARVSSMVRSGR